jgi:SAM-dependent methyltransferase
VQFVRCRSCASIYQALPLDPVRLQALYGESYHEIRGHSKNPAIEAAKRATTRRYLRMLQRYPDDTGKPRRLLEVGCSAGAGLAAAVECGWEAEGVEISAPAADTARHRPGVRAVYCGRVQDLPLPAARYDAVVLFDVIEHIDPPQPTLAALHRLLVPGGVLLMVTPDAGSFSARMMGAAWVHLFIEHVILFSRRALRQALESAGFSVECAGFAWKRVNLDMLVRHATIHSHIMFGGALRMAGRVLPAALLRAMLPFNIGEFYMLARRPEGS